MKENRHKIATQKFLKIATFLEKISTFVFFIAFLCNNFSKVFNIQKGLKWLVITSLLRTVFYIVFALQKFGLVFPENKTCSFLNSIWLWFGRPHSSSPIIPTRLQCLSTCLKAGGKCNHFDVLFSSNILLKICMHCLKDNRDHCGKNL